MRALAVAVALFAASSAWARHTTVTVSGQAVVAGNPATARAQAIGNAIRKAVAQVATSLGAPGDGDDGATDRAIYDRAAAYVTRSSVTGENVDGTVMNVDVTADVDVDTLKVAIGPRKHGADHAAKGSTDDLGRKRVLILATEQLGEHQIIGWTDIVFSRHHFAAKTTALREVTEMGGMEATFADGFSQGGFKVIDPQVLRGKLAPKPAFERLELSESEARSIAQRSDADLVVVAKGVSKIGASIGEMLSGQANVAARLVRVKDGKVLAATTQHAAQVHIDADTARIEALNEAAKMAAQALTQKINAN